MYQLVIEESFRADYRIFKRTHPDLLSDLREALDELRRTGTVPEEYRPHLLSNPGGNYNGYMDFHLGPEEVDVVVLYRPHKSNPSIRLVRIGAHDQLFRGPLS